MKDAKTLAGYKDKQNILSKYYSFSSVKEIGIGSISQMSFAYSPIVLSLENLPQRATLSIDILVQRDLSIYAFSTAV